MFKKLNRKITSRRYFKKLTLKSFLIYLLFVGLFGIIFYYKSNKLKLEKQDIHDEKMIESADFTIIPIVYIYTPNLFPGLENEVSHCSNKIKIVRYVNNNEFDAAIVHFNSLNNFMNSHKIEEIKKLLIIVSLESPMSMPDITSVKKYFNVLIGSYFKTSGIYLPYGFVGKKLSSSILNIDKLRIEFEQRKSMGLSIISNCGTSGSIRLQYIEILDKVFKIQTMGSCFNKKISQEEKLEKMKKYKFFLSFENSNCDGYITEKFFEPLKYGAIPIVMGGKDYSTVAIPGSYINSRDFSSPTKLGEYLNFVSSNFTEYLKYFQYTKTHECILPDRNIWFDDICDFNQLIRNSVYGNFKYDETVDKISNQSYCFIDNNL